MIFERNYNLWWDTAALKKRSTGTANRLWPYIKWHPTFLNPKTSKSSSVEAYHIYVKWKTNWHHLMPLWEIFSKLCAYFQIWSKSINFANNINRTQASFHHYSLLKRRVIRSKLQMNFLLNQHNSNIVGILYIF